MCCPQNYVAVYYDFVRLSLYYWKNIRNDWKSKWQAIFVRRGTFYFSAALVVFSFPMVVEFVTLHVAKNKKNLIQQLNKKRNSKLTLKRKSQLEVTLVWRDGSTKNVWVQKTEIYRLMYIVCLYLYIRYLHRIEDNIQFFTPTKSES